MIQFGADFSTLGVPETGLSPTITIRDTSDGSVVVNGAAMTEVGGGAYKYDFDNDTAKKYSIVIDGGVDTLDSRYMTAWSERAKTEAEIDGFQGTDGKVLISANAQDLGASLIVDAEDSVCDALCAGASHNIPTSLARRVREIGAFAIESGTAQAGTLSSITLAATANGSDGVFNRNLIVLTGNTGKGQTRTIVDYNSITKVIVVDRDWRVIPDDTTEYQVTPDDTPLTVDHGLVQGATATTITIRDYASSVNNAYLCNIVTILAGKGRGQARLVGAYNGTTKVVTICGDDWIEIPDTTSIYAIMPYGTTCVSCVGDNALNQIQAACDSAISDAALATAAILKEVNQSLNGAKIVIDRAASTFKVYDTDGTTLMFTITKSTVGNVDTLTRT